MARTATLKPLTDTELVILNAATGRKHRSILPWQKSLTATRKREMPQSVHYSSAVF